MLQSKILSEADLANFEERIITSVNSVFDQDGNYLHGEFLEKLDVARRGWILRGIHPNIAETSRQHIASLDEAASAVMPNPSSGLHYRSLNGLFSVHDDIDAFDFDLTPKDDVPKELKLRIEKFAMETFYSRFPAEIGHRKMADYAAFESKNTWASQVAFWLDKQDAATHAKHLQNNWSDLETQIKSNDKYVSYLIQTQGVGSYDAAISALFRSLDEFYVDNVTNIFPGTQMEQIAEKVSLYKGKNVKKHYLNLLSSHQLK